MGSLRHVDYFWQLEGIPSKMSSNGEICIAVVIPCYRVRHCILDVIAGIGPEISIIYVVDDCCPENSGEYVKNHCSDPRVRLMHNPSNLGVGGTVISGYRAAMDDGADIIVKLDGDGQMDPGLIPRLVMPILDGEADYTKGNRFFDLENIHAMPRIRLLGNAVLSFMTKISSGYWNLFDPTNGFTAIHSVVAGRLPFDKISQGYFFETDMLFRLNALRAVAVDVPMDAQYGNEVSSLKITNILGEFLVKHVRNGFKRIFYNYYLRDLSLASIELPLGLLLLVSGGCYGIYHWIYSTSEGITTPAGTVMLAALPVLVGLQFILAFLGYDIASVPTRPLHTTNMSSRHHATLRHRRNS